MAINLALLQTDIHTGDIVNNLSAAAKMVHSADADLVVLPEMFATGFASQPETVVQTMNGQIVEWIRAMVNDSRKAVMGGVAVEDRDENGVMQYYNRMVFCDPSGRIVTYDKRHLFRMSGENRNYTQGDKRVVINYCDFRIMPIICYDLRFPVWSRNLGDYDLLIDAASWGESRREVWCTLLKARAIENVCYVAGVNRVGEDVLERFAGDSQIVDFHGNVMVDSPNARPHIISATLHKEPLNVFKAKFPVWLDADSFSIKP